MSQSLRAMISVSKSPIWMEVWMEALGMLHEITEVEEGLYTAAIGPAIVFIPEELAERLESHIGEKIGILRTDHDYRLRIFESEINQEETKSTKSNPLIESLGKSMISTEMSKSLTVIG